MRANWKVTMVLVPLLLVDLILATIAYAAQYHVGVDGSQTYSLIQTAINDAVAAQDASAQIIIHAGTYTFCPGDSATAEHPGTLSYRWPHKFATRCKLQIAIPCDTTGTSNRCQMKPLHIKMPLTLKSAGDGEVIFDGLWPDDIEINDESTYMAEKLINSVEQPPDSTNDYFDIFPLVLVKIDPSLHDSLLYDAEDSTKAVVIEGITFRNAARVGGHGI